MDRLCDQLLARSALPPDQDGGVGLSHRADHLQHLAHLRALTDDATRGGELLDLAAQPHVLGLEPPLLDGAPYQVTEFVGVDRLGDVVEGALLEGLDRGLDRCVGRDHDHDQVRIEVVNPPLQLHPVDARHLDVEQDHIP